jgi:hypothetical protein
MGDSYYEYMIKQYLQTSKREIKYLKQWEDALVSIKKYLIGTSGSLTYVTETTNMEKGPAAMEHLSCYFGGLITLGISDVATQKEDLQLAEALTETCFQMYNQSATGVGAEKVSFDNGQIRTDDARYILRPEAIESIYHMWKFTGDLKWREYGWKMFENIQKACKLENDGFSALRSVDTGMRADDMESFWLVSYYIHLSYSIVLIFDASS